MSSNYSKYSPFYKVQQQGWYLDYNLPAAFPQATSDTDYTIPSKYNEQPWRLAKDLYGNERLYYIFALVNPNLLGNDPIYDFKTDLVIKIPTVDRVRKYIQ